MITSGHRAVAEEIISGEGRKLLFTLKLTAPMTLGGAPLLAVA